MLKRWCKICRLTCWIIANKVAEGLSRTETRWWRRAWNPLKEGDLLYHQVIYMLNRQTHVGLCCFYNKALIHLMHRDCFETSRAGKQQCILSFLFRQLFWKPFKHAGSKECAAQRHCGHCHAFHLSCGFYSDNRRKLQDDTDMAMMWLTLRY